MLSTFNKDVPYIYSVLLILDAAIAKVFTKNRLNELCEASLPLAVGNF